MKEWWNKTVRDYFTFSAVERNGVVVLCTMILLVIFLPQLILLFHKDDTVNFEAFKEEVSAFQKGLANNAEADSSKLQPLLSDLDQEKSYQKNRSNDVQPFFFDPNSASASDFRKLGLNDKVIKAVLNYRDKGGKFFSEEDFKKIYVLKEEDFNRLAPYIQITSEKKNSPAQLHASSSTIRISPKTSVLDLNRSDSMQLVSLPGIGSVLSSRIIKFRNKLGGFYSPDQLKEVYGFSPETFDEIKDKISVNASDVKHINLNDASIDELKQHPYFKSIAQLLINYRDQHGDFKTLEDLKNIDVITDQIYEKIIPYTEL